MMLHRASRELVYIDVTSDVNPATATLDVRVSGGAWEAWAWTGPATGTGPYKRTAQRLIAGPDATPGTALVLAAGRHPVAWRLTGIEPEQPARDAEPITVS